MARTYNNTGQDPRCISNYAEDRFSIMKLPQKDHERLARILDPRGPRDWERVAGEVTRPDTGLPFYAADEVQHLKTIGEKKEGSCTKELLRDMDSAGLDVCDLVCALGKCGNIKAVEVIVKDAHREPLIRMPYQATYELDPLYRADANGKGIQGILQGTLNTDEDILDLQARTSSNIRATAPPLREPVEHDERQPMT